MLSRRIVIFLMLVAALLATSSALGQSTATIQGTVTDSKGAVVPNATVIVKNRNTSAERTTQTDSDGNYQFAALPVGLYTVEARVQGFKTQIADQVTLEVGHLPREHLPPVDPNSRPRGGGIEEGSRVLDPSDGEQICGPRDG